MVYLAADNPLPLIEWQENITPFCVTELSENEQIVKKQFTKPFIVYAGSFEGCSCGFSYDDEPCEDEDDTRRDTLARESVKQLSEYLSNVVKKGSVEIFACWDGDQSVEPEVRIVVTPSYFSGNEFAFGEKQFIEVVQN